MNRKTLTLLLTSVFALFLLSGCSVNSELISLETPFSQMSQEGLFTAILTYPLAQAINFLSGKLGVFFGIAIVAVLLNAIIIAVTFKSNIATQKMQMIQPELQKIQLKYEGREDEASKQRMAAEMQALYKKHDIHPLTSILVTFIQIPVLFSMYAAVRRSFAVANGTFLGVSLSLTPKEAFSEKAWILLVIYVLMVGAQFAATGITHWLQEARDKKMAAIKHKPYEKPANSTKMTTYSMVIFIAVIMLSWPTALSLYYLIYSCINIVKAILLDKIVHKGEE